MSPYQKLKELASKQKLELEELFKDLGVWNLIEAHKHLEEIIEDASNIEKLETQNLEHHNNQYKEFDEEVLSHLLVSLFTETDKPLYFSVKEHLEKEFEKKTEVKGSEKELIGLVLTLRKKLMNQEQEIFSTSSILAEIREEWIHESNLAKSIKLRKKYEDEVGRITVDVFNDEIMKLLKLIQGNSVEEKLEKLDNIISYVRNTNKVVLHEIQNSGQSINDDYLVFRNYIRKFLLNREQ